MTMKPPGHYIRMYVCIQFVTTQILSSYRKTMQESCEEEEDSACVAEAEWTCMLPQYLCGATCRTSSPSTCSGKIFVVALGKHDSVKLENIL